MRWFAIVVSMTSAGCYCSHTRGSGDAGTDAAMDAGSARDGGVDAWSPPEPDAGPVCAADGPNADVEGTTPLGPIRFDYAWAGRGNTSKACFEVALHATDASSISRRGALNQLWAWIPRGVEPVGVHTGVWFTLALDGVEATTERGVVEILRYERDGAPVVTASIAIEGDGWDVHGTLDASYCERFRDPCL